ncbi:hypothetical protein RRG08_032663 [Elysia crispata]|uniref:Fucosyltransferase n=1 Tax=Elysia crispata TaxID=231223 RepID=A0AAE0Y079_9GAST|nr:hypothetical protein RRG08_032663 [Elysia crispata]
MKFRLKRTLQLVVACACVMVYINFLMSFAYKPDLQMSVDDRAAEVMEASDLIYQHRTPRPDQATFLVNPESGNKPIINSSLVTLHNISNTNREARPQRDIVPLRVIYPDEAHYTDDRIKSQLELVPEAVRKQRSESSSVKTKKILVYSGLGGFAVKAGKKTFSEQQCQVQDCELTGDRNLASHVDVVLFQSGISKNIARRPDQVWIIYMLESPYHTPGMQAYKGMFNWTATYRHDSTIVAPYEKFVPFNSSKLTQHQTQNFAAGKTKKVAWFVSNCGARNSRMQYAMELSKHIEVDIYGNCGKLRCPRSKSSKCFELLDKDYKFYLSFENSNCRDYITEKFFVNGLKHNVLPIVMGAAPEDYARAAPPHSFIHVDDFESPKDLAEYLHVLDKNDALYNEYFQWKGTGDLINTFFWCRVCALAHDTSNRGSSWYENINDWWRGKDICIGKKTWREVPRSSKLLAPLAVTVPPDPH